MFEQGSYIELLFEGKIEGHPLQLRSSACDPADFLAAFIYCVQPHTQWASIQSRLECASDHRPSKVTMDTLMKLVYFSEGHDLPYVRHCTSLGLLFWKHLLLEPWITDKRAVSFGKSLFSCRNF